MSKTIKGYKPHDNQRLIHDSINHGEYKYYALNIGRQFGKSLLAVNQVLHWFEIWCFLIKEMESRNIVRRYFSMNTINYNRYFNNQLFKPYTDIIANEISNNLNISSAVDYSNSFYGREIEFNQYLLQDMEPVIFTELYNENPSKDFFENQLKTRKKVGGHPSSVVYRKMINEILYL
jgi:hypothetical protein